MVGFGLVKAKSQKRVALKAGIFGDDDEEDVSAPPTGSSHSSKNSSIVAVNRSLSSYASSSSAPSSTIDPSIYDFDGAIDKRNAERDKANIIKKSAN